jgi:hypothetical protein
VVALPELSMQSASRASHYLTVKPAGWSRSARQTRGLVMHAVAGSSAQPSAVDDVRLVQSKLPLPETTDPSKHRPGNPGSAFYASPGTGGNTQKSG